MTLRRIELVGFKSFAGRTVLEFDDGIAGVPIQSGEQAAEFGDLRRGHRVARGVELDASGAGELLRRDAKGEGEARGVLRLLHADAVEHGVNWPNQRTQRAEALL